MAPMITSPKKPPKSHQLFALILLAISYSFRLSPYRISRKVIYEKLDLSVNTRHCFILHVAIETGSPLSSSEQNKQRNLRNGEHLLKIYQEFDQGLIAKFIITTEQKAIVLQTIIRFVPGIFLKLYGIPSSNQVIE